MNDNVFYYLYINLFFITSLSPHLIFWVEGTYGDLSYYSNIFFFLGLDSEGVQDQWQLNCSSIESVSHFLWALILHSMWDFLRF